MINMKDTLPVIILRVVIKRELRSRRLVVLNEASTEHLIEYAKTYKLPLCSQIRRLNNKEAIKQEVLRLAEQVESTYK